MLTRAECFKILKLEPSSGPNAIKRAYRKLAFELHPDLNPGLADASRRFQELNEAYVMLMREYSNTSFSADFSQSSHKGAAGHEDKEDARARAEAKKAYQKAGGSHEGKQGAKSSSGEQPGVRQSREEILRDLLSDPFARRVYEDIYSHVRHNTSAKESSSRASPRPAKKTQDKIKIKPVESTPFVLAAGSKVLGLAGGLKNWLRKQIDEEQVMYLPSDSLRPGVRIRLQVRHGLSEESRSIEFTLPPEFKPGRPIRLKGLGKRLGKWQGDLYLRVFSREGQEED